MIEDEGINSPKTDEMLAKALISSDIPYNAVENPDFRAFCEHLGYSLKSKKFYNQLVEKMGQKQSKEQFKSFIGCKIALRFDESSDSKGQKILNILINKLKNDQYCKPIVVWSGQIENTGSDTVYKAIKATLDNIMRTKEERLNLCAIISDGASYCKKVAGFLAKDYENSHFIICLCHNLHNLADTLRLKLSEIGKIIAFLGGYMKNSQYARLKWKMSTGLPELPSYVSTRWGLWLACAFFVSKNYKKYQNLSIN